ncbi:MAG: hypothetical protein ACYCYO_11895 [Bacilli bacterium]
MKLTILDVEGYHHGGQSSFAVVWYANLPFDKAEKCPSSSKGFDNQSHASIGFDGEIFARVG